MVSGAGGSGGGAGGGETPARRCHLGSSQPYRHQNIFKRLTESIKNIVPQWLQHYFSKNEAVSKQEPPGLENREDDHLTCADEESTNIRDGRVTAEPTVSNTEDRKCELNLQDNMNSTALMKAIQAQEEECVSLLLERGADSNIKDVNEYTALHHAALNGSVVLAARLLQHQADIEATGEDGSTPFMLAVYVKNKEMVEFLIRKNANVNASDNSKRTALMLTVKNESSNTVRLLLQQNVDVSAVDDHGWTAENYASFKTLRINCQLICDYEKERRCKESSENSNLVQHSQ